MRSPSCEACLYFTDIAWTTKGREARYIDGMGHCRRYPPVRLPKPLPEASDEENISMMLDDISRLPIVDSCDFCGEFKDRDVDCNGE